MSDKNKEENIVSDVQTVEEVQNIKHQYETNLRRSFA